jgi:signal transduction histidine kinase
MMKYESFLGIPIHVPGSFYHSLVAFSPRPNAWDDRNFIWKSQLCAAEVGRALERELLTRSRKAESLYTSRGMGLSVLAHELYSELSAQSLSIAQLCSDLESLLKNPPATITGKALQNAKELQASLRHSHEIAQALKGIRGRAPKHKPTPVLSAIQQAWQACRAHVKEILPENQGIVFLPPDIVRQNRQLSLEADQWLVNALPTVLNVIFFNLFLNAAQQLHIFSTLKPIGYITYSFATRPDRYGRLWGLIRILDSGPGIHAEDWDNIFTPGFTTKSDGSGLGLYICSLLLSEIRDQSRAATIRVTESSLLDRTIFTVRLPLLHTTSEAGHAKGETTLRPDSG